MNQRVVKSLTAFVVIIGLVAGYTGYRFGQESHGSADQTTLQNTSQTTVQQNSETQFNSDTTALNSLFGSSGGSLAGSTCTQDESFPVTLKQIADASKKQAEDQVTNVFPKRIQSISDQIINSFINSTFQGQLSSSNTNTGLALQNFIVGYLQPIVLQYKREIPADTKQAAQDTFDALNKNLKKQSLHFANSSSGGATVGGLNIGGSAHVNITQGVFTGGHYDVGLSGNVTFRSTAILLSAGYTCDQKGLRLPTSGFTGSGYANLSFMLSLPNQNPIYLNFPLLRGSDVFTNVYIAKQFSF